jgi:hypothetical protein
MQKQFSEGSTRRRWFLDAEEEAFISRYRGVNRLQCAALLKFFQAEGRFPRTFEEIPTIGLFELSRFFGTDISEITAYHPQSGTSIRHRADIREFLGFRPPRTEDYLCVQDWLCTEIILEPNDDRELYDHVRKWYWDHRIELPAPGQVERIVSSSLASFEDRLFRRIAAALPDHSQQALDRLFVPKAGEETNGMTAPFSRLKMDPGKPSLNSVWVELSKLSELTTYQFLMTS